MNDEHISLYFETESVSEGILRDRNTHWHDNIELIYVLKGSMFCQTNQDVFHLQKGDICFINRNQLHHLSCDHKIPCEHKTLILDTHLFLQEPSIYNAYVKPIIDDHSFSHIKFEGTNSYAKKIYSCMEEMERLKKEKPTGYELGMIAQSYLIMQNLYCVYLDQQTPKQKIDINIDILQEMITYIYNHYGEPITLEEIAQSANISVSKCNRIFKSYTSLSPITYLNNYRLEKSAEFLRTTTYTISEISQMCGFSQQSYFNRMFLREYGLTPLKYRNNIPSLS